MSRHGFLRVLREFGRAPIADARVFERQVVLPQVFVFIAYISVGAALREPPSASILKLATVAYLVLVNMIVQSSLTRFSVRLLAFHVAALALLLSLSCLIMTQPSLPNVFVPMSVVILALAFAPLTWNAALTVSIAAGLVLGLFWLIELVVQHHWWYEDTRGPLLVCCSFFILLLKTLARPARAPQVTSFGASPRTARYQVPQLGGDRTASFDQDAVDDGAAIFTEEMRSEFFRRLSITSVAFAAVMLIASLQAIEAQFHFRAFAALLLVLQVFFLYRQARAATLRRLYGNALILAALGGGWCILSTYDSGLHTGQGKLSIALLILSFGGLPWSTALAVSLPCVVGLFALLSEFDGPQLGSLLLVILAAGLSSLSTAVFAHHAVMVRAILLHLRRLIEVGISTAPLLRHATRRLVGMLNIDRALLVGAGGGAEIIGEDVTPPEQMHEVFVQGLEERIAALQVDEGIMRTADLGDQFLPALLDWFGTAPRGLMFFKARAVVEGNETTVLLILPVRPRFHLIGAERLFRSAVSVFTVVRGALSATRSRFLSSDVLLETQNLVAEREQELGQVVHLVNNIAQDLSIQCESLSRALTGNQAHQDRVRLIETLARNLSAGVSDIKLQRELLRLGVHDRSDEVDVEVFLEEVRLYGRYREHRRGDRFEVVNEVPAHSALRVVSREFLETALRSLMRCSVARMEPGGKARVRAIVREGAVCIQVQDSGRAADYSTVRNTGEAHEREAQFFSSLQQLAKRSGGDLAGGRPDEGFGNCFELILPMVTSAGRLKIEQGHWALLVDDNAQVTTFYSRVAEALNLKYFSAASVTEAEARIKDHGRPRIVITDIQLGAGSGLDLVRTLRQQFGDALPVIVVSGHTAEALAEQVSAAGATKYLVKPVGRAKLFSEIRSLLSASA